MAICQKDHHIFTKFKRSITSHMAKKILLSLSIVLLSVFNLKSQCITGVMDATINVTTVYQTTPVPGGSPSYFSFNGIAGATYYFTYCAGGGSYVGDPYLTIASNAPAALVWNDDFCGLGSNLTSWVCPSNAIYRIYTSGCCPCGGKSAGSQLAFKYDLPPCSGTPAASNSTATPLSLCAGATGTLGLTTLYNQAGFAFQWQNAPTGGGPWTNMVGATSSTYSGVMNSTLFYRCIITCTPSGLSATSNTVMVTVNPSPSVSISGTNQICAGQGVNLIAGGAVSYTWNNGSNVPAQSYTPATTTSYSVIGLSAGCTGTAMITVTVNPNPTVTIVGSNTACAGTPFTLTGNGAVTYTWSTGDLTPTISATPTGNITYTVIGATAAGCTGFATHAVTVNPVPTVTVSGPNSMCIGQTVTLSVFGANSYSWSNGMPTQSIVVSPTTMTTYSVYGISPLGCQGPPAVKILNVNPKPNIVVAACSPTICKGETCNLNATGANTYSWNTGALTTSIIVSPTTTANYTVTGTNTLTGCMNTTTFQLVVSLCTGVDGSDIETEELAVYPNPNSGEFTIALKKNGSKNISIYDITGKEVYTSVLENEKLNVNISKMSNGIYYLKVYDKDESTIIKIVKQK